MHAVGACLVRQIVAVDDIGVDQLPHPVVFRCQVIKIRPYAHAYIVITVAAGSQVFDIIVVGRDVHYFQRRFFGLAEVVPLDLIDASKGASAEPPHCLPVGINAADVDCFVHGVTSNYRKRSR